MTASAARTVQAQLCFEAETVGQPALAAATRRWFTEGAPALGGRLWTGLRARTTPPGEAPSRWAGEPGDVWGECWVRFPFRQDWGGYSEERWAELLDGIDGPSTVVAFTAYELAELGGRCYPGHPRLSLTGRYVDPRTGAAWSLKAQVSPELIDEDAMLGLMRAVAEEHPPSYGEISYDAAGHIEHITAEEHERGLRPWLTVRQARRLRGYGWLTVVSERIGASLGGTDALRATGAWSTVEQLASGAYWLLATGRLAEYGPERAAAVRAALEPALPPTRRPRYRPAEDDEAFLHRIDARDSTAFQLAVALRMLSLHRRYPDALIWGTTRHEDGPHLICWGADGDDVWVWRVVPDDDPFAGMDILRDPHPDLAEVAADPLSRGHRVVAGPLFADVGLARAEGSAFGPIDGEVGIYDAAPGLQLCYAADDTETKAADRLAEAMQLATTLKRAVLTARAHPALDPAPP